MVQEQIEDWVDTIGYEGLYQVSSLGRVKSLKRKWVPSEFILKPYDTKHYLTVGLSKGSPRKITNVRVHSLVYTCFEGELPEGLTINHIDGNKHNNHRSNLELLTLSDNVKDAHKRGSYYNKKGLSKSCKLSLEEALVVKESKLKSSKLASFYKVSTSTINNIKRGLGYGV